MTLARLLAAALAALSLTGMAAPAAASSPAATAAKPHHHHAAACPRSPIIHEGRHRSACLRTRVHAAQTYLRRALNDPSIRSSGNFDAGTRRALLRFQAFDGLPGDGILGPRTWAHLRAFHRARPLSGPDISSYQGSVDFWKVRAAQHTFVITKAIEGSGYVDPTFTALRVALVHKAGLVLGVYDFARPAPGWSGAQEARRLVAVARSRGALRRGDLPAILDLEVTRLGAVATAAWAQSWCRTVLVLTHRGCLLYTGAWFWDGSVGGLPAPRSMIGSWLSAYYYGALPLGPPIPVGFGDLQLGAGAWLLWQYTDRGRVPGIRGLSDVSTFNGSARRLRSIELP